MLRLLEWESATMATKFCLTFYLIIDRLKKVKTSVYFRASADEGSYILIYGVIVNNCLGNTESFEVTRIGAGAGDLWLARQDSILLPA
jgi:hypothetical protein